MKAVVCDRYGPPEVLHLEDVPRPVPAADEVLIRVRATTVTRTDDGMRNRIHGSVACSATDCAGPDAGSSASRSPEWWRKLAPRSTSSRRGTACSATTRGDLELMPSLCACERAQLWRRCQWARSSKR